MPGEEFSYNTTNYLLLTCIVEQVARLDYPLFVRQHIFEPLG